ncbi:expressed unknown protein [Ectocarpus siliculosus]|uniref:Uncharacterized protein n=1 Tax=Ectocarpus siliculosus TaxID=2880 RepID=D8LEM9_ECTSI|nr:expressed unknown protein [Ectocarpus siliculosus]|eukprot:CBN78592.1 expressed unknown protein [Ectocarpus siliculosus]
MSATGNTGADIGTNGVALPHQQQQQPQQSQAVVLPPALGHPPLETDQQKSLDDTTTVPGTTASNDDNKDDTAEAAGDSDGWAEEKQEDDSEQQLRFGTSAAPSQAAGRASDAGVGGVTSRPHALAPQKRGVDWRELKGNLNFLLKEEGELTGRDLNHAFQQRFGKSPFLDGTPLRYAVSAGWLKGVCYDLTNKCFNLTVRVPAGRREDPPDGAPTFPPTGSQLRAGAPRRDVPRSLSPDDFDWGRLSTEFRQLLLQGALEPKEVHVKYHREFRKPLILGEGYNMRQAVTAGLLIGITFDPGSRRLMCA